MKNDMCIEIDENDRVLGAKDKYAAHRWNENKPPPLHRAFSLFLFNSKNELLLQQRASTKITFPDVWTNTCCSHPLHVEAELESRDQMGVKRAAIRKIDHELGIPVGTIAPESIKFLTRVHYSAPFLPGNKEAPATDDKEAWKKVEWGEHEIDYILFAKADVELNPHPDEVRDTRYVSQSELHKMMSSPELKWSPWFRKIVNNWYDKWIADVDTTLTTDKHVDDKIHRV